jgi:cytochrome c peroxidase
MYILTTAYLTNACWILLVLKQKGKIMHRQIAVSMMALLLASSAVAAEDDLMKSAKEHFKAIPATAPAAKNNAVSEQKIDLGKMLFFDPRISASTLRRKS